MAKGIRSPTVTSLLRAPVRTTFERTRWIASGQLPCGMQGAEKCNESRCLGGTQIISVSRHVAAALQHLANELVLRKARRNGVQRWAALASCPFERMAVATLFALEYKRPLTFECRPAL